jgi:hypothetical protein
MALPTRLTQAQYDALPAESKAHYVRGEVAGGEAFYSLAFTNLIYSDNPDAQVHCMPIRLSPKRAGS